MELLIDSTDSPLGEMVIATSEDRLLLLEFHDDKRKLVDVLRRRWRDARVTERSDPLEVASRLRAYFAGRMDAFNDLLVDGGGTPFQKVVWEALLGIPAGTTQTYGELAARIGRPSASRAVGMANSLNPIAIVVPCHRVIGAGGALTGYSAGLERKQWLLRHEGALEAGGGRRTLKLFEENEEV